MRVLISLFFAAASLFAVQASNTTVKEVKGKQVILNKEYVKGISGVVIHTYAKDNKAIVAAVVATGGNTAKIVDSKMVKNPKLPAIATKPAVGDKVIMGYLYNRSLLIVPNESTFKRAQERYGDIDFVNPDLLAFTLMNEGRELPNRRILQEYCNQNAIGLIYLVTADMGYFIDVNSFEILSVEPINSGDKRMMPFYMQLQKPGSDLGTLFVAFYDLFRQEVLGEENVYEDNYDKYYLHLLGSKDDE
ncbi:MAG: plasminogen-binding N-terminal domain-containing protein [Campylobacterota bacterium]